MKVKTEYVVAERSIDTKVISRTMDWTAGEQLRTVKKLVTEFNKDEHSLAKMEHRELYREFIVIKTTTTFEVL